MFDEWKGPLVRRPGAHPVTSPDVAQAAKAFQLLLAQPFGGGGVVGETRLFGDALPALQLAGETLDDVRLRVGDVVLVQWIGRHIVELELGRAVRTCLVVNQQPVVLDDGVGLGVGRRRRGRS